MIYCACGHSDYRHITDVCVGTAKVMCSCLKFVRPVEKEPDTLLQVAASHLAGLGRGRLHRLDVDPHGVLKLDHVPLRGVTDWEIRAGDATARVTLTMDVSLGREDEPA
jgi:hypothetical protein